MFLVRNFCLVLMVLAGSLVQAQDFPDTAAQNEIKAQLLELAVANFNGSYARMYDSLISSENTPSYGEKLMEGYSYIRAFREMTAGIRWSDRQYLHFPSSKNADYGKYREEYRELLDSDRLTAFLVSERPPVPRYESYRAALISLLEKSEQNLIRYDFEVLRPGSTGDKVDILRQNLKTLGYLDAILPDEGVFDSDTADAVTAFQKARGLTADGIAGYQTYETMFRNRDQEAVNIARTMIRMADPVLTSGGEYIFVNVPDMNLNVYSGGKSVLTSRVIVGRKDRQTPLFTSALSNVVLNPTWTAPPTIMKKDYAPKLIRDRGYLAKHGLALYDSSGYAADPAWLSDAQIRSGMPGYRIVQSSGTKNALGLYKFNFPNTDAVYLHSTNSPGNFQRVTRAMSSGCVRVEKSKELAEYVLRDTPYSPERIAAVIKKGKTQWAPVKYHIPVYVAYLTAFIGQNGEIYQYPDVYGIDSGAGRVSELVSRHFSGERQNP